MATKTFEDLVFEDVDKSHPKLGKRARMQFDNGYGISVLLGKCYYSNGVDTYEVAVLYDDYPTYSTGITDNVLCGQTAEQITKIMEKIAKL